MNIVMVNGEKQGGKSTFCGVVKHLLDGDSGIDHPRASKYSLVTPIESFMLELWSTAPENTSKTPTPNMEVLKRSQVYGRLGRDWMIAFGDAMRTMDEHILIRMLFGHIEFIEQFWDEPPTAVLVENWGFPSELIFARSMLRPGDKLITVHLNERQTRDYAEGEKFDNDNRFSLQHMAQWINPTPGYLAHLLDPSGGHPSHNLPYLVELGSNWIPPN